MKTTRWLAASFIVIGIFISFISAPAFSQGGRPRYSSPSSRQQSDVIPEDTILSLRMNDNLSSRTARVGDRFTATVTIPVYVAGTVAIPAGAVVSGRVTQVTPAKRMNKSGVLAIEFDEISLPNGLSTQIVGVLTSDDPEVQKQIDEENRVSGGKGKDAAVFVGGSGVLGAILGGVAGGGKGAAVGGAVGAGVGAASVLFSKGEEATVPAGAIFGLRLKQSLPVPDDPSGNPSDPAIGSSPQRDPAPLGRENPADVRARSSQTVTGEDARSTGDTQPINTRSSNRAGETDSSPPITTEPENEPASVEPVVEEVLPLSSPEMIRRAQTALNQEGYYEGEIDGSLNPRTVSALKTYQRENNLTESGTLDAETAKSLKLAGAGTSQRRAGVATTSTNPASSRAGRGAKERISSPDSNSRSSDSANSSETRTDMGTSASPASAVKIQAQAEELLAAYQKMIGVRLTGTGLEFDRNASYTDDDIGLLFAIDSFVNAAQLYGRMLPGLRSEQAIRSATLSMAKEARKTDRIFTTSTSRWVNGLTPRWDALRQEVLKLMYSFDINTSELDN